MTGQFLNGPRRRAQLFKRGLVKRSQATVEALHIIVVENRIEELKVRVPTN